MCRHSGVLTSVVLDLPSQISLVSAQLAGNDMPLVRFYRFYVNISRIRHPLSICQVHAEKMCATVTFVTVVFMSGILSF